MERRQQIQRAVYVMAALDVVVLFIVILLSRFSDLTVLAAICLPTLLIFNFLFLRRKLRTAVQDPKKEGAVTHSHMFSVYACSTIFFVGTLYGVLMILQGELPRTVLPLLLVPLSLAVYCLKTARRAGARKSNKLPKEAGTGS